MLVYKYQKIDEWFYKNLINMEIFCNSPENFNDPFDCSINIINKSIGETLKKRNNIIKEPNSKALKNIEKEKYGNIKLIYDMDKIIKIQEALNNMKKNISISCFTTKVENELMWAHYANSHNGVCIGYEINELLLKVNYDEIYPTLSEKWINGILDEEIKNKETFEEVFKNKYFEELIRKIYLTKSKSWDYEKEWRLIQREPVKKIDKSQIKSIYFGLKTSKEDIKKVIKLLDDLEIKIPIYQMEKVNGKFLFEPKLIKK